LKYINKSTANQFHDWQRTELPGRFVIQDLDTWILLISDTTKSFNPLALVEEKRSTISPDSWTPFKDDLNNYLALYNLSVKAKLPLWIIYFTPDFPKGKMALFKVLHVDSSSLPWITYEKQVLTAKEFQQQFSKIFS